MTSIMSFDDLYNFATKSKEEGGLGLSEGTATTFALNATPESGVSFYIHRVFNNINYKRIKNFFIRMNWGFIDRVDLVHRGDHKSAFVHFRPGSFNTRNVDAMSALNAAIKCEEVKLVYDSPWYWKLQISTVVKTDEAPKPPPRAVLQIGDGKKVEMGASGGKGGGRPYHNSSKEAPSKPTVGEWVTKALSAETTSKEVTEEKTEQAGGEGGGAPKEKTLVENFSGLKVFLKTCRNEEGEVNE